jgi:hypothetical protein
LPANSNRGAAQEVLIRGCDPCSMFLWWLHDCLPWRVAIEFMNGSTVHPANGTCSFPHTAYLLLPPTTCTCNNALSALLFKPTLALCRGHRSRGDFKPFYHCVSKYVVGANCNPGSVKVVAVGVMQRAVCRRGHAQRTHLPSETLLQRGAWQRATIASRQQHRSWRSVGGWLS